jgi:threonine dehydratase
VSPADLPVHADDVATAAIRLRDAVARTPAVRSATLSEITGADIVVKCEHLQFTASFKERGACNRLLTLTADERARGVLAVSAGNHALALSHHAHRLGIACTVVVPATTPWAKIAPIERSGAVVVLDGETFDDALAAGARLELESGAVMVPPFDDPYVIAGQGTVALELLDDSPDLDVLVVPVGGGGLVSGMAVAARARRPDIEIVGVQSDRYPAFVRAGAAREPEPVPISGTIAEGIAVKRPGVLTARIVDALVDDVVAVPETRIEEAISYYLEIEKMVAEGAGAAALAAVLDDPARFRGRSVGLVLSGANIDLHLLAQVIMRSLARSGRLTHLTLALPDRPGALAAVAGVVAGQGANIISVTHDRDRPDVALKLAELEITVETQDAAHRDLVVRALTDAGFPPTGA